MTLMIFSVISSMKKNQYLLKERLTRVCQFRERVIISFPDNPVLLFGLKEARTAVQGQQKTLVYIAAEFGTS